MPFFVELPKELRKYNNNIKFSKKRHQYTQQKNLKQTKSKVPKETNVNIKKFDEIMQQFFYDIWIEIEVKKEGQFKSKENL